MPDDGAYRIQVTGLREFEADLKKLNAELPQKLKAQFLDIATKVADKARLKVPKGPSGRARASVKPHGTLRGASVTGGSAAKAPYYPWLEFGGGKLHARGVTPGGVWPYRREWKPQGRYLYPAAATLGRETFDAAEDAIRDAAKAAHFGIEG